MPQYNIRFAGRQDMDILHGFGLAMAKETEGLALDAATLRAGIEGVFAQPERGFYLLAEDAEAKPLGSLMVTYEWSDWRNATIWWIQSVYVTPHARGQGVYRALYEGVLQRAKRAEVPVIRLYVYEQNQTARHTYEKLGMAGGHYVVYEAVV